MYKKRKQISLLPFSRNYLEVLDLTNRVLENQTRIGGINFAVAVHVCSGLVAEGGNLADRILQNQTCIGGVDFVVAVHVADLIRRQRALLTLDDVEAMGVDKRIGSDTYLPLQYHTT